VNIPRLLWGIREKKERGALIHHGRKAAEATVQASKAKQSKDKVGIRVLTEWT
jgi:hypothetical protein